FRSAEEVLVYLNKLKTMFRSGGISECEEEDSGTGAGILEIFETIRQKNRTTILMVTHDQHVACLSDRTIRMHEGKTIQ
ncbi:MAG: hypothetical protein J6C40_13935, partial [Lentisphaeria bacterium]|nr:hypothetical protein [Lentisphaeria bacterium]